MSDVRSCRFAGLAADSRGQDDDRPPLVLLHGALATFYAAAFPARAAVNVDRPLFVDRFHAMPEATITLLPNSGHFPHLARPAEFAGMLASQR